jgi:hypothetical protein
MIQSLNDFLSIWKRKRVHYPIKLDEILVKAIGERCNYEPERISQYIEHIIGRDLIGNNYVLIRTEDEIKACYYQLFWEEWTSKGCPSFAEFDRKNNLPTCTTQRLVMMYFKLYVNKDNQYYKKVEERQKEYENE